MSIIYVPANKNSFWQQIYNGNGLYGLAMSQLVKGFMNGVNKRHEAYIDKQVQDRNIARSRDIWNGYANTGTSEQTAYNPMEQMQFQGQTPQERQAFGQGIKNPLKQYGQNEFANTANEGLSDIAKVWDNAEGYGVKHQTVNNPITAQHIMEVNAKYGVTPDEWAKFSPALGDYFKNAADLADAQQRVKLLQGMQEPQTVNQIGQSSLIAGKDMTNAYNFVNPQLKLDVRNAGDRSDYTVFNPRTGDMTTTQGQPYGISAEKAMEDTTKREIHYSPSGSTIYTQAHTDKRHADTVNKGLTPNQQIQSVYAGGQLAQMYGDDIEGLDTAISSFAPNIQPYIRMGAGSGKVYDKGKKRYITNPTKAGDISAPQPKPQAQPKAQATWKQPAQLSADEQAWVNYVKSNTDTTGMTTAQILALRKKK